MILALRLAFGPKGCDLGLEAVILAASLKGGAPTDGKRRNSCKSIICSAVPDDPMLVYLRMGQ